MRLDRALVFEPDLLLLDEPLGALDKNLREQMQIEIKRIQKTLGVTTIFVTHDQSEAMSMSDRIVVFSDGVIEQAGKPLDIYHRPNSRFVADFIGESNLLPARIIDPASRLVESPVLGKCIFTGVDGVNYERDQEIALVLRPEHLRLSREPLEGRSNARMVVETIVNYGDNALVIGRAGEATIRVRVYGADVVILQEGDECSFSWLEDDIYIVAQ